MLPLPRSLVGAGTLFMLEVKGDSMVDAAICDGDYVVIRQQPTAENGEIVCAVIDGEATLKRFFQKDGIVTLRAENEKYPPITVSEGEFRIVGRIVGLLRKF